MSTQSLVVTLITLPMNAALPQTQACHPYTYTEDFF